MKAVEFGLAALLVAVFVGSAFASMGVVTNGLGDMSAAVERRDALVQRYNEVPAGTAAVAGVQLDRSADGQAICLWTVSTPGLVLGIWESQGRRLYGRFDVKPEGCPNASLAAEFGFGPNAF